MYENRKVFAFILARGGSKGVPRKNVRIIAGKPLVAHSIDVAKKVKYIDKVCVSTDDKEIKEISLKYGAVVVDRPSELAVDTANYLEGVKHMISVIPETKENPIIVILETTTPIKEISDIEKCIETFGGGNIDCVASVNLVKAHPSYIYVERDGILQSFLGQEPIGNRQASEPLYAFNGSIFVTDCNFLLNQKRVILGGKMKGYLMDEWHSVDIDAPFDFEICKYLMESKKTDS